MQNLSASADFYPTDAAPPLRRWLSARRVQSVAVMTIVVTFTMLAGSFLYLQDGRTLWGPGLGADFACFYSAGTILRTSGPEHLYDQRLQSEIYHRLLPGEAPDAILPYAYPPLLAKLFEPFSELPYALAYLSWTAVSAGLFFAAVALLCRSCPDIPAEAKKLGFLLTLAFEPFAVECIHGGQISTIAAFLVCLAIYFDQRRRPLWCGAVLGAAMYKPTLLLMIVPMLIAGRRFKSLGAMIAAAMVLTGLSFVISPRACGDYFRELLSYGHAATHSASYFRTWKFVDINSFLKLLAGGAPGWTTGLTGVAILTGIAGLWPLWHRAGRDSGRPIGAGGWACALTGLLVLNAYVGIYDTALLAPAVWLSCQELFRRRGALDDADAVVLSLIFVTPWISQLLARGTGFQLFTPVLLITLLWHATGKLKGIKTIVGQIPQGAPAA